jgi:hypothetical protein
MTGAVSLDLAAHRNSATITGFSMSHGVGYEPSTDTV